MPLTRRSAAFATALLFACAAPSHATQQSREAARLNNLGAALMDQGQLDAAAAKFAQAAHLDPKLSAAKLNQGIALLYLQKLPEARVALDAAAAQAPRDPRTWYALGLLDRTENNLPRALEDFQKVLALDPADADSHYLAGSIDFELKDLPAAMAEYRKALALEPLHASAQFGLARTLQRSGEAEQARAAFAVFQHITTAKLGYPLSHNYGQEGRYGHVEDAPPSAAADAPMVPVTFAPAWHSPPTGTTNSAPCAINFRGALTLILPGSNPAVRVLRNTSTPAHAGFETLTNTGLPTTGATTACAAGDFDNDGLPDIALAIDGAVRLFKNLGDGHFREVTADAHLAPQSNVTSLTFVDFDHDGDLDLLATGDTTTLWRNNGNGTFTNWTHEAGFDAPTPTFGAILSDLNNDRAVDLLLTTTHAPAVYSNRREGPFAIAPLYSNDLPRAVHVATLDFNKDGWMDVLLTHAAAPGVTLWRNVDGHNFERVTLPLPAALSASAAIPIDFDNDGWIDIAAIVNTSAGTRLRILRNLGPRGFVDVSAALHLDNIHVPPNATLLAADFRHTGAQDILVTAPDGSVLLLANHGGNRNHSLRIALTGVADNKSGIGAKVEVFANGLWQKWESNGQPEILAGLGTATHADLIRLLWPTGVPQDEILEHKPLAHAGELTEIDRRGSSCPTLFAWNGQRYTFVSDVIGAAVIGHWTSPTAHNTPDPDEWIKVSAAQLREHNGTFSLRFGEPMEEVNFVDQVRLVAVDHPANSAVFPNEGFLSEPPFAAEKTIATTTAHPLTAATDNNGQDVLALLSRPLMRANPAYVRDFTNLTYAGFANPHTLTVDIGPWSPDAPLRLLLHGFVEYFSASSMYAAWQAGLTPVPPSIEAQMPDGTWRKIVDDMGFPAGLPRTVVVDLTGKLPAGTRKLRITTNLQIYWDQLLVDNERSTPQPRHTELTLNRATLAFRGYPKQNDGHTPGDLNYDYASMSPTGPFIPHRGAYTRYGDVTPLLQSIDDKFVIFGTGEDMDLEFSAAALPPLPQGWTRDFFFYANGFVKDMDFYEASPFEVGKLPFHGMSAYPYPPAEHYPDDAAHTAYQLEYNTRWEPGVTARRFEFRYQAHASQPDSAAKP